MIPAARSRPVTIATAAYPLDQLADWAAYEAKLTAWVADAAARGADVLVFPEYGAMELAAFAAPEDLQAQIDALSALVPDVDALHARLAGKHNVHILAASVPARLEDGRAVNRARLFTPEGGVGVQDKQIMTRWERDVWRVSGAAPLRVFDTTLGRIGVLICYDAEFPLLGRALVEAGVELLLVPSATETLAGYWRVRIGAMARAMESQCFAAMASIVGDAPWSEAVDANTGASGIYAPPDRGIAGVDMPEDGVVAVGEINAPGWTLATVDLAHVAALRADGGVLGVAHWPEQTARLSTPVETSALK